MTMTMNPRPTFCPYAQDSNDGSTPDDNARLDALFASIDQVKSARDTRDTTMLTRLRRKHDIALDTVMQAVPSVTRVIAISDHLDAIRKFRDDPYRIWNVEYGKAGIIRDKQHDDTRICGIGLLLSSQTAIALLPEQEYDLMRYNVMLRERNTKHIHVNAGVYDISWVEEDDCGNASTRIRPLELSDTEWSDMDMWDSYARETDVLKKLARALTTFESNYWCYACGVVDDAEEDAAGA